MLFNSISFLIFFPIVTLFYYILPSRLRNIWLLMASYYFYMNWNAKYALLILASTVVTYLSGLLIERSNAHNKHNSKYILILCLVFNLGILFVFKYFNFVVGSLHIDVPSLNLILPVGISFYTFQALGYVIDCYRSDCKAEHNFINYALFVSFYPQLVAGPIERSTNLLQQIRSVSSRTRRELLSYERIRDGLSLMIWGLFLKLVIADRVGILVDTVFQEYYRYGSCALILGAIGFGIQINCDFGSYSTIAIGAAKVMGFELMDNFNAPYLATSIGEFWRRWHISLSIWFRDYLYIPLGGNRKGFFRKLINILVVFTVSGLWHGAAWTFVLWGLLHGTYQVIENLFKPLWRKICMITGANTNNFGYRAIKVMITFMLVDFAWIFFRAASVTEAFEYIHRLFTVHDLWQMSGEGLYTLGLSATQFHILIPSLLILLFVDIIYQHKHLRFDKWLSIQWMPFRVIVLAFLLTWTIVHGIYGPGFDARQFIYFQF